MDSNRDIQRAINAERIASVIAHQRGHSFEKHKEEFGNNITAFRQAVIDTLLDPKTLVIKAENSLYRFYNKAMNVMVVIDQSAMDWGTAFKPDGNRGMSMMRERGIPINENGAVTYLDRLHSGYFTKQDRLQQHPAPLQLRSLSNEQMAEVLLSIFEQIAKTPARPGGLCNSFHAAGLNVMPEMIAKLQSLPPEEKETIRNYARRYKEAGESGLNALKNAGLMDSPGKGRHPADIQAILRDPAQRETFIERLEEQYALTEDKGEEEKLGKMLNACAAFGALEGIRREILEETGRFVENLRQDTSGSVPQAAHGQVPEQIRTLAPLHT